MDLAKLLKVKAEYGDVYAVEYNGRLVACRQPTLGEIIQLEEIAKAKNLSDYEKCVLIQKVTMVEGEAPDELLAALGEQILVDVPSDDVEYLQNQMQVTNASNVHEDVLLYLSANFGMNANELRKLPLKYIYMLFGLAKKVEEMLAPAEPEPVQHRIQVTPKVNRNVGLAR